MELGLLDNITSERDILNMTNNNLRRMSDLNVLATGNYMAYPDQILQNVTTIIKIDVAP